jgi:hypothetical protein
MMIASEGYYIIEICVEKIRRILLLRILSFNASVRMCTDENFVGSFGKIIVLKFHRKSTFKLLGQMLDASEMGARFTDFNKDGEYFHLLKHTPEFTLGHDSILQCFLKEKKK